MDRLEQFLMENREMLNQTEPPEGHFERFESRLQQKQRRNRTRELYRVTRAAALILVLISSTIFIYQQLSPKPVQSLSLGEFSPEMAEVEFFFTSEVDNMTQTIRNYPSPDNQEYKNEMLIEVEKMDSVYNHLKMELAEFPGEESIVKAMIQYYQTKLAVIQKILSQLQQIESVNNTNIQPNENINF